MKIATVGTLVVASAVSLYYLPGRAFLPQGQVNELWVRFEAPVGSTLSYTDARIRQVEEMLKQEPYAAFIAACSADVKDDEGRLFVRLKPNRDLRKRDAQGVLVVDENGDTVYQEKRPAQWHALAKCVQAIRQGCDQLPDLKGRTFVTIVDKVRGGDAAPIALKIYRKQGGSRGSEAEDIRELQRYVRNDLLPTASAVTSGCYQRLKVYETPQEVVVNTDARRTELHERGLTTQQISDTIRASVYGVQAETVQEQGRDVDITVLLGGGGGAGSGGYPEFVMSAIRPLKVRSPVTGRVHGVEEVAVISDAPEQGSVVLERTNRKTTASLESHVVPYAISGETVGDVSHQIQQALHAVPGFDENYTFDIKNTAKDTEESFRDASYAFMISIVLVYMIMCSQFERLGDPLAIMITVPLASIGSVTMLHLTGEITSLGALVGGIILCGVVVNNGIILVEYINILRARGVGRTEAIIQGSVRKLRSILITSLTSILGMLPLVLGVGEGTELYRGVAAVIVGGLLVSTPFTLVALPLLYSVVDEMLDLVGALSFRLSTMLGVK